MKYRITYLIYIVFPVIFMACTKPADSEFGSLRNIRVANEILNIADRQIIENNLPAAELSYKRALREFSLIDHQEGKVRSYLGMIKVAALRDSMGEVWNYFAKIEQVMPMLSPELSFMVLAGKTEWYSSSSNYDSILIITTGWDDRKSTEQKITLLTFRLFAHTELGKSAGGDLSAAEKIFLSEYEDDPYEVKVGVKNLSSLGFAIASQHYLSGNYDKAKSFFTSSLIYDKVTGNYSGIAENLYMLGLLSSKEKDYVSAEDFLTRSFTIAEQLGIGSKADIIRTELAINRIQLKINPDSETGILRAIYGRTGDKELKSKITPYIK